MLQPEAAGYSRAAVAPVDIVFDARDPAQPAALAFGKDHDGIMPSRPVRVTPDMVVEARAPSTQADDDGRTLRL